MQNQAYLIMHNQAYSGKIKQNHVKSALPCKVRGCQGRFLAVRKRVKREYERSFDTLHMVVIRICIRLNADPDHTPFGVKHLSAWKEFTKFTFIKEENIIFFVCVSWLFRPLIKKISKCKWKKFISMFRTFLQIFDDFSLLAHPLCERIRNLITGCFAQIYFLLRWPIN